MEVNTASAEDSIWRGLHHATFRRNVVALQRAFNEVPSAPMLHHRTDWQNPRIRNDDPERALPFEVEQRLADNFAFLAAAAEGVKAVSAVGLEEGYNHDGLLLRLAANQTIPVNVPHMFATIFDLLSSCATSRKISRKVCAERILDVVVESSQERLHNRLQSVHWRPPPHKRGERRSPLCEGLRQLSQGLPQRLKDCPGSGAFLEKLGDLSDSQAQLDSLKRDQPECVSKLKEVIRKSHDFCASNLPQEFDQTISKYGLKHREIYADKRIEQVNKIGRYWGSCVYMAKASKKYPGIFKNMQMRPLLPYQAIKSSISFKDKEVFCHVHAEIQLVTFYGHHQVSGSLQPRVVGTSKLACYLCSLFIVTQGNFFLTKTHGRLYDQWNVPDLAAYDVSQRREYRHVLAKMNEEIKRTLSDRTLHPSRAHPMTSSANLPFNRKLSPLGSEAVTLLSTSELPLLSSCDSITPSPPRVPAHSASESDSPVPLVRNPSILNGSTVFAGSLPEPSASSPTTASQRTPVPPSSPRIFTPTGSYTNSIPPLPSFILPTPNLPCLISHTIFPTAPCVVTTRKICTEISLDGAQNPHGKAIVQIQPANNPLQTLSPTALFVDLDGLMPPNEELKLERADGDDAMVLVLKLERSVVLMMKLSWIES